MARIITDVSISLAFDHNNPPDPPYPLYPTKALWDTGATGSVITNTTAKAMGLVPVGSGMVKHADGMTLQNLYVVNIILPNRVGVSGVAVSECKDNDGSFGVIIGMDIIATGDFSITNADGKTCMSFRIPSVQRIDYVTEANRITYGGTPRNAPCPCGKKDARGNPVRFKDCHQKIL